MNFIKILQEDFIARELISRRFESVKPANVGFSFDSWYEHRVLYLHGTRYGYSPDALGPAGVWLEVKTRAKYFFWSIRFPEFPQYFVQCQLQVLSVPMQNFSFCSHSTQEFQLQFFFIKQNNTLNTIIKKIIGFTLDSSHITE